MTIKELYEHCAMQIKDGMGDNKILICVNGDEFYQLEQAFSSPVYNEPSVYNNIDEYGLSEDEVSILN